MSDSDWVDDPHSGDGWVDDNHPATQPSSLESSTRGLAQGASFGFADEGTGALEALWDKIKGDPAALEQLYQKHRDESRANYKAAKDANPTAYTTGQIGGAVGTTLIPGLGEANLAKLAAMGGAQGLGSSEADLTKGDVAGAVKDTAIGAGTGLLVGGAAKALPSIGTAVKNGLEDVATAPFGSEATNLGVAARGINAVGKAGRAFDDLSNSVTQGLAGTGNKVADKVINKIGTKAAYGLPVVGKAIALADQASAVPAVAQKGAQLALKGIDKIGDAGGSILNAGSKGATSLAATQDAKQFDPDSIIQKSQGTKYQNVLQNAQQRGPEAFRAANFVLQGQDPEYRKLMVGDDDRQNEDSTGE